MNIEQEWTNVNYMMEMVKNEGDKKCERAFDFLLGELNSVRKFWDEFCSLIDPDTIEIEIEQLYESAVKAGLMEFVPFDPKVHPLQLADFVEPGEKVYALTERGKKLRVG